MSSIASESRSTVIWRRAARAPTHPREDRADQLGVADRHLGGSDGFGTGLMAWERRGPSSLRRRSGRCIRISVPRSTPPLISKLLESAAIRVRPIRRLGRSTSGRGRIPGGDPGPRRVDRAAGARRGGRGSAPWCWAPGGAHLKRFVTEANFTLHHRGRSPARAARADRRALDHVPLHRIQAAELSQPLLWRMPGWWRLRVNVAGVGGGERTHRDPAAPGRHPPEALAVLDLVRPGIPVAARSPPSGRGVDHGFSTASPRARLLDPLSWQRRGTPSPRTASSCAAGWSSTPLRSFRTRACSRCDWSRGPCSGLGVASVAAWSRHPAR